MRARTITLAVVGIAASILVAWAINERDSLQTATPTPATLLPVAPTTTSLPWCTLREAQNYVRAQTVWPGLEDLSGTTTSTTEARPFTAAELHASFIDGFSGFEGPTAQVAAALDAAAAQASDDARTLAIYERLDLFAGLSPARLAEAVAAAAAAMSTHAWQRTGGLPRRADDAAAWAIGDALPGAAAVQTWADTVNAADRLILNAPATIDVGVLEGSPAALLRIADTFRTHADSLTSSYATALALLETGWIDLWRRC